MYYDRDTNWMSQDWVAHIKNSMRTATPQFSMRRMVKEYVERLYIPAIK